MCSAFCTNWWIPPGLNKKIILDDTFWWCFLLLIRCLHIVTALLGSVHIVAFQIAGRITAIWNGNNLRAPRQSRPMQWHPWLRCNFAAIHQVTIGGKIVWSRCHWKWRVSRDLSWFHPWFGKPRCERSLTIEDKNRKAMFCPMNRCLATEGLKPNSKKMGEGLHPCRHFTFQYEIKSFIPK